MVALQRYNVDRKLPQAMPENEGYPDTPHRIHHEELSKNWSQLTDVQTKFVEPAIHGEVW